MAENSSILKHFDCNDQHPVMHEIMHGWPPENKSRKIMKMENTRVPLVVPMRSESESRLGVRVDSHDGPP